MIKPATIFLTKLAGVSLLLLPCLCSAQSDKKSEEILKAVSSKYKTFTTIQADFSFTIDHPGDKTNETQTGSVQLKGGKYHLVIKGQDVLCDGKTVWNYVKESNEVQINDPSSNADAITPANVFTMYEKGFENRFIEEKQENGKTVQVIELKPVDIKRNYFKIRLTIDKNEKLIITSQVFSKNGDRQTYTIKKFTPNIPMEDASFIFNKASHPGVVEVDLR